MSKEVEDLKDAISLTRPLLALLARMSHVCNCRRQVLCPEPSKLEKNMKGTTVASPTCSAITDLAMDSQVVKVEQGHAQMGYEAFTAESAESQTDQVKGVEELQNTKTLRHRKSGSNVFRLVGFDHNCSHEWLPQQRSSFRKPMRPFEKECQGAEMKVVDECGIKDKCEVWREQFALARIRN